MTSRKQQKAPSHKEARAYAIVVLSLDPLVRHLVIDQTTAHGAWTALTQHYEIQSLQ